MTSPAALAGLVFAFSISSAAPFAAYFILRRRMTLSWRNIGIGAAVFFVFALVLEASMHYLVLTADPATSAWFKSHRAGYVVYGVLAAGLFEEGGRFLGMRFLVRPTGNPGTAVAYGLGHGGIESLLIGALGQAQAFAMALLLKAGMLDTTLGATMPRAVLAKVHDQFSHLTFLTASIGGFERIVALGLQIALSFVVWRAVEQKKIWLVFAAIGLHAASDLGAGLYQAGFIKSVFVAEAWGFAALGVIVLFVRSFPRKVTVSGA
jgi:uncharacterized membrane protein YhfC